MVQHGLKNFGIQVHILQDCWGYIASILLHINKRTMSRQWQDILTEYEVLRN